MPTDLLDQLRQTLGAAYTLERELGGGGMSRVFLAEETALGRRVVVKVLAPELAAGVSGDRFRREIQLAAGLQHPHIIPVLTAGTVGGAPFFTMPYVSGESLRTRLNALDGRRGLPLREALGILRDVAKALVCAHRSGVVHRDIKPDNVLLSEGSAAVTDFGIAKALSSAQTPSGAAPTLTVVGTSIGTPQYMAPEQAAGDPGADHRVDIYAFGVLAYELLAGKPPFHGRGAQALLAAHMTEAPPALASARPDVPPALGALVMRCLAKDAEERPQTAAELVEALDAIDTSGEWAGRGARPIARRLRRAAAALAAVALVAAAGYAAWARLARRPPVTQGLVAVAPFRVASADPSLHYLREGMLDLLAAKLGGEQLRVMEPRALLHAWARAAGEAADLPPEAARRLAARLGAGRLLLGDIVGTPTRVVISASLFPVSGDKPLAHVSVEGAPDSLAWLVDRLALRLLSETSGEAGERGANLTSTSVTALRAYLDGQAKLRRGDVFNAAKDFTRALAEDSTFALAGLGLRLAASWYGDPVASERGLQVAWRERAELGPRDQALLTAVAGPRYPQPSSTAEIMHARERYLNMARDHAEAWYLYGDHIFHYGDALGVDEPDDQALTAFRRAIELDSTYVVGYLHVLPLAVKLGDTALVRRVERLRLEADTSRYWVPLHRWHQASHAGDTAAARAAWDSMPENQYFGIFQHALNDGTGARDVRPTFQRLLERAPTDAARRSLHRLAHDWALHLGRPAEARRHLEASADSANDINVPILAIRDALVGDGDPGAGEEAARTLAALEATASLADSASRLRARAVARVLEPWRLARGDTSHTRRSLERLRAILHADSAQAARAGQATTDQEVEIAVLEALHADVARRDVGPALARLDSLLRATNYQAVHGGRTALANLVAARLFEQRGDVQRALAAVRRRGDRWTGGNLPYVTTLLREEGRLAALAGDREGAIQAYRHYLALRYDPEPVLRAQVDEVRRELARLERAGR